MGKRVGHGGARGYYKFRLFFGSFFGFGVAGFFLGFRVTIRLFLSRPYTRLSLSGFWVLCVASFPLITLTFRSAAVRHGRYQQDM